MTMSEEIDTDGTKRWFGFDSFEYRRKPEARSTRFKKEWEFCAHVNHLLYSAGYEPEIERGVQFEQKFSLRWDLGIRITDSPLTNCDVIVEFKVKAGMSSLQRALGQCLIYKRCYCAEEVILCFPSDLEIPYLFGNVCQHYDIKLASETNILAVVESALSCPVAWS